MRIIRDYELSRRIICSKAFRAFPMADSYHELSARFGHDFGPTIVLLERLPTFMDGEAHKQVRMTNARQNERNKPYQLAAATSFLAGFKADALQPGRELDLLSDLAQPLFRAIAEAATSFANIPAEVRSLVEEIPLLFSTFTPLKRRLEINGRLRSTLDRFGNEIIDDLVLMVLGVNPLVGSLALSLHAVFRENPAVRFSAIDWPPHFNESALQYVDRICKEPVSFGQDHFGPGERIRCLIQSPEWTPQQSRSLTFGTGSHLCLGRSLAELVWAMTVRTFAVHEYHAEAGALVMNDKAEPFEKPARAPIVIRA